MVNNSLMISEEITDSSIISEVKETFKNGVREVKDSDDEEEEDNVRDPIKPPFPFEALKSLTIFALH